jgi:hypothetical protein
MGKCVEIYLHFATHVHGAASAGGKVFFFIIYVSTFPGFPATSRHNSGTGNAMSQPGSHDGFLVDAAQLFLPVLQFPLSASFHQCSILIHSSTTDAV